MAKQAKITDEALITGVYALLGLTVSQDRAFRRITVVLTPGQQIQVVEESLPIVDVPDAPTNQA